MKALAATLALAFLAPGCIVHEYGAPAAPGYAPAPPASYTYAAYPYGQPGSAPAPAYPVGAAPASPPPPAGPGSIPPRGYHRDTNAGSPRAAYTAPARPRQQPRLQAPPPWAHDGNGNGNRVGSNGGNGIGTGNGIGIGNRNSAGNGIGTGIGNRNSAGNGIGPGIGIGNRNSAGNGIGNAPSNGEGARGGNGIGARTGGAPTPLAPSVSVRGNQAAPRRSPPPFASRY